MSRKLTSILILVRPVNFIIAFITAIVAVSICSAHNFCLDIAVLTGLSAAITLSAGNIINDVFDVEIDKINRPRRPIPSGKISENSALVYYAILVLFSMTLAYLININAFLVVLCANIILFIYSKFFKRIPLAGNIVVAFLTGLVFIFGGLAVNNPDAALIPAGFAFMINMIREMVKDMEDVEGDKIAGVETFPLRFGFQKSKFLILTITISLIMLTAFPFITKLYKIEYFVFVMVTVNPFLIYSLKILFENHSQNNLKKASSLLKLDMVFGLIAIYVGI